MLRIQHQHLRAKTTIAASRMAMGLFAANGLVSDGGSGLGPLGTGWPGKRPYGPFTDTAGQPQTRSVDALCGE